MSIFSKLFKRRDEEVINTDELVNDVLLKAMLRGEKIDKDKALSLPAVSSAVDRITNTIAMIPIKLYKETIDKNTGRGLTGQKGFTDFVLMEDFYKLYGNS